MPLSCRCCGSSHDRSGECWLWVFNEQRWESEPGMESFKVPAFYYQGGPILQLMTNPWLIDIQRGRRERKPWVSHQIHVHACTTREILKVNWKGKTGKKQIESTSVCAFISCHMWAQMRGLDWLRFNLPPTSGVNLDGTQTTKKCARYFSAISEPLGHET